jgi:hypothetical protein
MICPIEMENAKARVMLSQPLRFQTPHGSPPASTTDNQSNRTGLLAALGKNCGKKTLGKLRKEGINGGLGQGQKKPL